MKLIGKLSVVAVAVAFLCAWSVPSALACGKCNKVFEALDLTDDQADKIGEIKLQCKDQCKVMRTRMSELDGDLFDLVKSGTASEAEISTKVDEITKLQADKIQGRIDRLQKISAVLDDSQRETFFKEVRGTCCGQFTGGKSCTSCKTCTCGKKCICGEKCTCGKTCTCGEHGKGHGHKCKHKHGHEGHK